MADPRFKQMKIQTGVVKRLAKEIVYYDKEAQKEQARHDKKKEDGCDEYELKKQLEVIQESKTMISDTRSRLTKAQAELKKMLDNESDLKEAEEFKEAENHLQEAEKVLTQYNV